MTVEDIIQKGDALQHFYEKDLAPSFALELAALKNNKMICEDLQSIQNIPQLLKYLINSTGASSFTNVIQALQLYLTLPVSVATAERSFSKLKIIKNFLRNAMSQERLHSLSIIAIEKDIASNMDMSVPIKIFAEKKSRKINL